MMESLMAARRLRTAQASPALCFSTAQSAACGGVSASAGKLTQIV